jgi:hypothetical protein
LDEALQSVAKDHLPRKPLRLVWESEQVSVELAQAVIAQLHKRIGEHGTSSSPHCAS